MNYKYLPHHLDIDIDTSFVLVSIQYGMATDSTSFRIFRAVSSNIVPDLVERPLGLNEVFIKEKHSGLCATDLQYLHAGKTLGHEGVGIVRKTGPGVTAVKEGDRVGYRLPSLLRYRERPRN